MSSTLKWEFFAVQTLKRSLAMDAVWHSAVVACMAHRCTYPVRHGSLSKEVWHKEAFCTAGNGFDFVIYRSDWLEFQKNSSSV